MTLCYQTWVILDEKLFTTLVTHNFQNDQLLTPTKKTPKPRVIGIYHTKKPVSVMVWATVTKKGNFDLAFIAEGVKINNKTYVELVLQDVVMHFAELVWRILGTPAR